jgi:hypothetical protein
LYKCNASAPQGDWHLRRLAVFRRYGGIGFESKDILQAIGPHGVSDRINAPH